MLTERLSYLPEELPSFRPCPAARERAGWARLPGSARQRLPAAGEAAAARPPAPPPRPPPISPPGTSFRFAAPPSSLSRWFHAVWLLGLL